jgi:hypothetical protein
MIRHTDRKTRETLTRLTADLLLKQAQLQALGKSSQRNHKQLLNWIMNNKPLGSGKYDFIFQADDFVSPGKTPEKDRWFEDLIESWLDSNGTLKSIVKVCIPS